MKKIVTTIIFTIYAEILCEFLFGIMSGVLSELIVSPGDAGFISVEITGIGYIVLIGISLVITALIITPAVWTTLRGIRKKHEKKDFLVMWSCILIAGILALVLLTNGVGIVGRLGDNFAEILFNNINMFTVEYNF